jgi:hypothetical protein
MTPRHTHITDLTSEREWNKALDEAATLVQLQEVVRAWMPYVPDALAIVEQMDDDDFLAWRLGLSCERKHVFAGPDWVTRFGALAMPIVLGDATLYAQNVHRPFGGVLLAAGETLLKRRGFAP